MTPVRAFAGLGVVLVAGLVVGALSALPIHDGDSVGTLVVLAGGILLVAGASAAVRSLSTPYW